MGALTIAQEASIRAAMGRGATTAVNVQVMDKAHNYVSGVLKVTTCQVTIDSEAQVDRTCELTLFDPNHAAGLKESTPQAGALYLNRMIRVRWGIFMPWGWVSFPVFTGPIVNAKRDVGSPLLMIQAHGKEAFMRPPVSVTRAITYPKGTRLGTLVRNVAQAFGEQFLSIPESTPALGKSTTIDDSVDAWDVLLQAADSCGYRLFYDARGVLVLGPLPVRVRFTYRGGDGGTVWSPPSVDTDLSKVHNAVRVIGATPKGSNTPISAWAFVPSSHWASPTKLMRGGKPQYYVKRIEDTSITTLTEARERARAMVRWLVDAEVNVVFDAAPVPFLDPRDMCYINASPLAQNFRFRRGTFVLAGGGASSVGFIRPPKGR